MSQPQQLPLFETELDWESLQTLYNIVNWQVVAFHPRMRTIDLKDTRYAPLTLFKALSLCYLLPIPTEFALERVLDEKPNLRYICGLIEKQSPTRIFFYRLRHIIQGKKTYLNKNYADIMRHTLIAIVIAAKRLNVTLPFVRYLGESTDNFQEEEIVELAETGITVHISSSKVDSYLLHDKSEKEGLKKGLGLPAKIMILTGNLAGYTFILDLPDWIKFEKQIRGKDVLVDIPSGIGEPYIACNVLVTRETSNGTEILLEQRNLGWGSGSFALPGGKKKAKDKTIGDCAYRELLEETSLKTINSCPISIRVTNFPEHPTVASIGVLVEEYKGTPKLMEPEKVSLLEWFPINNLPEPLFEPTKYVLDDYVASNNLTMPLTWEAVEQMFRDFLPVQQLIAEDSEDIEETLEESLASSLED